MVTSATTILLGIAAASAPVLLKLKNLLTTVSQEQIAQSDKPTPKTNLTVPEIPVTVDYEETKKIESK